MSLLQEELSIVVCSKSDYSGLVGTLDSLNSLYDDLPQIILVLSDYSKDELEKINKEFSLLKVNIIDSPSQGIFHAQNLGLSKVKRRLVLFLNGGDKLKNPLGLQCLVSKIGLEIWGYGEIDLVEIDTLSTKRYRFKYVRILHRLGLKYVPHPATVVDAEVAIRFGGFDENYASAADHKLLLTFSKHFSPVVVSDVISTFYRGGLSSRNQNEIVKDCKRISREVFGYFLKNKLIDSLIWSSVLLGRMLIKN